MSSRAALASAVAVAIAAGTYGGIALVRRATDDGSTDPGPRVAARDTATRKADAVLLDAIEHRFPARRVEIRAGVAVREYRDWIAQRFRSAGRQPTMWSTAP